MQFLAQYFLTVLTRCWPVSLRLDLEDKAMIALLDKNRDITKVYSFFVLQNLIYVMQV